MSAWKRQRPMFVPPPQGDALSHGMAMVAVPVVFGLVGALIDRAVGTAPMFLLVLALFGVAGSFASAFYRYDRRMAQASEGKPWTRRRAA